MSSLSFRKKPEPSAEVVQRTIIEPPKGWQPLNVKELRAYKDLFYFLVWRDVKVMYAQTVLGFAWAIIRPFMSMVIFTIVFGNIAQVNSDGVPYTIFNYHCPRSLDLFCGFVNGRYRQFSR